MQKVNYQFGDRQGIVFVNVDTCDDKLDLLLKAEKQVKRLHPGLIAKLELKLAPNT